MIFCYDCGETTYNLLSKNVNRVNVVFNISGTAKANSLPLTTDNRTFGIALNVYYNGEKTPESYYQSFNSNTTYVQSVSLSVTPKIVKKLYNILTMHLFMVTIRI